MAFKVTKTVSYMNWLCLGVVVSSVATVIVIWLAKLLKLAENVK